MEEGWIGEGGDGGGGGKGNRKLNWERYGVHFEGEA